MPQPSTPPQNVTATTIPITPRSTPSTAKPTPTASLTTPPAKLTLPTLPTQPIDMMASFLEVNGTDGAQLTTTAPPPPLPTQPVDMFAEFQASLSPEQRNALKVSSTPVTRHKNTRQARMESPLYKWLHQKGYYFVNKASASQSNKTLSHTFLDRGVACVPPLHIETFNTKYVETIAEGHRLFISELATTYFRAFFDIDIERKDNMVVSPKLFVALAREIQSVVKKCYEADIAKQQGQGSSTSRPSTRIMRDFSVVLLGAKPRQRRKRINGHIETEMKSAIHLVFPSLVWDTHTARCTWAVVVEHLEKHFTTWHKEWDEAVDKAVYRDPPHIRMPYSLKMDTCLCLGDDPHCRRCQGGRFKRTILFESAYQPIVVLNGSGDVDREQTEALKANRRQTIQRTCLRMNAKTCNYSFSFPPGFDRTTSTRFKEAMELDKHHRNRKRGWNKHTASERYLPVGESTEKYKHIDKLVKINYKELKLAIIGVKRDLTKRNTYFVQTSTRRCLNLDESGQAEHHNARIYFMVSNTGVRQGCNCHCPSADTRVSKKRCSIFLSKARREGYTKLKCDVLFPISGLRLNPTLPSERQYSVTHTAQELDETLRSLTEQQTQINANPKTTSYDEMLSPSKLIEMNSRYSQHAYVLQLNATIDFCKLCAQDIMSVEQRYLDAILPKKKGRKRKRDD